MKKLLILIAFIFSITSAQAITWRQVNTTTHPIAFLMISASDNSTGVTGLSPTVTISKDGAAFGAPSGAISELGNGFYLLAGNATDRASLGVLIIHATAAGCDPTDERCLIVGYDPFDSAALGLTDLVNANASLPNIAPGAKGGLPILDASTGLVLTGYGAGAVSTVASSIPSASIVASVTGAVGSVGSAVSITSNSDITTIKGALPAVAPGAKGGLPILDASTGLVVTGYGPAPATVVASSIPNVTVGGYATNKDPATLLLKTPANLIATDSSGYMTYNNSISWPASVTVGGYATHQDPGYLLLATPAYKLATDSSGYVTYNNAAPDNTDIASIKGITDQMRFTVTNQLDSNALSGGTSPSAIWGYVGTRSLSTAPATPSDVATAITNATLATHADITGLTIPSAASIWQVATSGMTGAGSIGYWLTNASGGLVGDLAGISGSVVSAMTGTPITIIQPATVVNTNINLVSGASYYAADGRSISFVVPTSIANLTGASVTLSGTTIYATTILNGGASNQSIQIEFSSAQTTAIKGTSQQYTLWATLANGHLVPIQTGLLTCR